MSRLGGALLVRSPIISCTTSISSLTVRSFDEAVVLVCFFAFCEVLPIAITAGGNGRDAGLSFACLIAS